MECALKYSIVALALGFATAANAGGRVEARVGYDNVSLSASDGVDSVDGDKTGVSFGAELGYDLPAGSAFAVGPYASFDLSSAKYCELGFCLKAKHSFAVGLRASVGSDDGFRGFVKGGYANGTLKASIGGDSGSESRGGWQAGIGVEYGLKGGAYLKAEYVHSDFKNFSDEDVSLGFKRDQLLAGVGWRF